MTIIYNAGELGTVRTLLMLKGTMILMVFKSTVFWLLMATHTALLVIDRQNSNYHLPEMNWHAFQAVTSLLTFFLVFYGSNAYGRLQMFYGHCVGIGGTCMNWVCLVRNNLPPEKDLQWNCTRLLLASMHIIYYTLNESKGGTAISADEWGLIVGRHLLSPSEITLVKEYAGYKPFLPLVWALAEVESAILGPTMKVETLSTCERYRVADLLENFRELAFNFRGHCGQITNWLNQPVPFPYYHGLNFVLLFDLLIISWGLITLEFHAALTAWIYFIICLTFLGLKEVAVAMSDPFGDDDVDFDIEKMLAGAYKNAVALLQDVRPSYGADLRGLSNPVRTGQCIDTLCMATLKGFPMPEDKLGNQDAMPKGLPAPNALPTPTGPLDDRLKAKYTNGASVAPAASPAALGMPPAELNPASPNYQRFQTAYADLDALDAALGAVQVTTPAQSDHGTVPPSSLPTRTAPTPPSPAVYSVNAQAYSAPYPAAKPPAPAGLGAAINQGLGGIPGKVGTGVGKLGVIGGGIKPEVRKMEVEEPVSMSKGRRGKK